MHISIISGGVGSRLWPISREANPKPFIKLSEQHSFLQKTVLRATALTGVESITTVTNNSLYFRTKDEYQILPDVYRHQYILEPFGRNTGPAITTAALEIQKEYGDDAILLVLPADHLIEDSEAFDQAVNIAKEAAAKDMLVTFGVKPNRPETGFGYIEVDPDSKLEVNGCTKVKAFIEKPNEYLAKSFINSGKHLWNAGMFCFKVSTFLKEVELYSPELLCAMHKVVDASTTTQLDNVSTLYIDKNEFGKVLGESIDYAVMEKSSRVAVVPCDFGWSDIGSWSAMSELTSPDSSGNRVIGKVELQDSKNCYINSSYRLTAAVGIEDIYIVDTPDALLVTHKDNSQQVKQVVTRLKARGDDTHQLHLTVHRPWGTYTILEGGESFKIKRIEVKPGASLSLQKHHHRSEHWIVVSGTAQVVNGEQDILLCTNESTYIPAGNLHRLSNPGIIPLVIIEVQSGEYLGEDDIVRFEDTYGRC